ncbi:tetraacyldisaccharide 4'-kinase [Candidatus Enterovibrio escicola]|uniref:tetraacyldisaccharide 4'-kinase n=1 Tax=Candidatus Enterovibrio escicola TaxID=1927127 RepID=UPI001237C9D1|nr:tetraacyldisaccharide 4'-kinase [Candidatus Enterovibrio escacola]
MEGWIDKIWFDNHLLGWLGAPLLWPLSKVFGAIARHRRNLFLKGKNNAYRAFVPVIVVGNITVGGNGKTPVVIWLVEKLIALGMTPGVVSRGYGGKAESYPLVLDKNSRACEAGDEPVLIYQRTGTPVAISSVRSDAIKSLLLLGVDIIITDDGLQHYKLYRDVELVIVDGKRRFGNEQYVPFGPLREQTDRLSSVDFVICNGGKPHQGEIAMSLTPRELVNIRTGDRVSANSLEQVIAMAGIGHPQRFFDTLMSIDLIPQHCEPFADHKDFKFDQLTVLANKGRHLVMTEKDAVKCRDMLRHNPDIDNWWYLPVDVNINKDDTAKIMKTIKKLRYIYGSQIT